MGITFVSADQLLARYGNEIRGEDGVTYGVFKIMVKDLANQFKKQEGRYYVLLSLEEAEHFRGVIHGRKGLPLLPSESSQAVATSGAVSGGRTTAALWVLADASASMLGSSRGFTTAPPAQHSAMLNCFRFMNSDVFFDDKSLTVLLRVLEGNSCEDREKWWMDIRACRRRRQIACDATMPVGTVFHTTTEFQFMEFKAVVDRVQWALRERGMLVFDAFRAFNSSNSGLMTCSELYGGLEFLGIPFTPDQVYDLVRKLALLNEGLVSYVDFKRVFKKNDDDMESHIAEGGSSNFEAIMPKLIPELSDGSNKAKAEEVIVLSGATLQSFKVKVAHRTTLLIILDHITSVLLCSSLLYALHSPVFPCIIVNRDLREEFGLLIRKIVDNSFLPLHPSPLTPFPVYSFLIIQINPVGSFEAIWTSQNSNSKSQAGIWAPSLDVTVLHSNKTRICLGHYANKGLGAPTGTSRLGATRYFMVELTDDSKSRISGKYREFYAICVVLNIAIYSPLAPTLFPIFFRFFSPSL